MNKFSSFLCLIIPLLLSTTELNAQWKQLDVGQPGLVQAVAVINGDVFAGTMAGIYQSTDDGASWTNVNSDFAYCFASRGSEIFAGTYRNGVVRSTDGGQTWTQPDTGFNRWIMALAFNDTAIFAGGAGMFRSTDDGASWTTIENGLTGYYGLTITGLVMDSTKLFATSSAGLLLSTDGGDNWVNLVSNALPSEWTNCIAIHGPVMTVGTTGGMVRSTDDGISWYKDDTGLPIAAGFYTPVLSLAIDSNLILAGTSVGLYISSDSGASWYDASKGLPGHQLWSIAADGTTVYAGTNSSGVFRSTDDGEDWYSANSGISASTLNAYSICGYGSFVCALIGSEIYSSSNNGTVWTPDSSLPNWGSVSSITTIGSAVYASTDSGIFVSSDSGQKWDLLSSSVLAYAIVKSGPNLIVSNGVLYFSSDGGRNWESPSDSPLGVISLAASGSNVIVGADSGIYNSNNDGEDWPNINNGPENISSLAAESSNVIAGRYLAPIPVSATPGPPGGVFFSTDEGRTWSTFASGLPEYPQVYTVAIDDPYVFVGLEAGFDGQVYPGTFYASALGESTWHNESSGLPLLSIRTIYVNDSSVFVGTEEGGVWRAPLSQVTAIVSPLTVTVPSTYLLLQNFPNPFNPTTTIDFEIPHREHVTLDVFDVLGRKIATLVDAVKPAGSYDVTFNASKSASGVYFYRLKAGTFVQTKKMVVIK